MPDVGPFPRALTAHARSRVVSEITERHPVAWMNPFWDHRHGLRRPDEPSASDAVSVPRELSYDVAVERWQRPAHEHDAEDVVRMVCRRLCVGPRPRRGDPRPHGPLPPVCGPRGRDSLVVTGGR